MSEYKHPEVLVTTEWVAQNLNAPNTRLVEVDVDTTAYDQGHIKGARLIPMTEIQNHLSELPKDKTIVTYCS